MRLSKIKLAGFKSFVDPTTIDMPGNLIGIVGPNGCGKSNTIDAVRWVMGESSAKHLRGDSMDDVIFTGSSARKPVGKASIELVFDNTDGGLGGQYAQYNEISIKREVSREGGSSYSLNGTKCRRRDITDIFLGTGLGPRSYAIIEQGMISRLIEAKPEELRVYLEEAAGISKYKERRRETENRIRHTRENLDRLNDLREEIEKQLRHLERQANTAEKYKELKSESRTMQAELLVLKLQDLSERLEQRHKELQAQETEMERKVAEVRGLEADQEKDRDANTQANEHFNEVQGRFYSIGGEITKIEQSIQHQKEMSHRQEREFEQIEQSLSETQSHIENDEQRLKELAEEIAGLTPEHEALSSKEQQAQADLQAAESGFGDWQTQWEEFNRNAAVPSEQAQVERTRMEQLERNITQHRQRLQKIEEEQERISDSEVEHEVARLTGELSAAEEETKQAESDLNLQQERIQTHREANREIQQQVDQLRGEVQNAQGRMASLEALQQAALGQSSSVVTEWLSNQGLSDAPRLAQEIDVESGWEKAAETVLGQYLEAVCVDGLDALSGVLANLDKGRLSFVEPLSTSGEAAKGDTLASKVRSDKSINTLLNHVFISNSLEDALSKRSSLQTHQSIITADGLWLGPNWLRVTRDEDPHAGVLERENEIKKLSHEIEVNEKALTELQEQLTEGREQIKTDELHRTELQSAMNRAHRAMSDIRAQLSNRESKRDQLESRRKELEVESAEVKTQISTTEREHEEATARRNEAVAKMEEMSGQRESLEQSRTAIREGVDAARQALREQREAAHQIELKLESLRAGERSTNENLARMRGQLEHLQQRRSSMQESMAAGDSPVESLEKQLTELLTQRKDVEKLFADARNQVQEIENRMRERDKKRMEAERHVDDYRAGLERIRMAWQELKVRRDTINEQLVEVDADVAVVTENMSKAANIKEWEEGINQLEQRINRLGPINLAAIDEFKEQNQRKEYLDAQNDDLVKALETLESAISKIDKETRSRFRETFERVNARISEMFPRLFGGGDAHLEMTGDDLLTTGVSIMARPPGKRISTIHLMSGGEKALTAVAMVFAIFELNPAPFCMLDEVDAPLDEANVGRFCDLVREMSERVQFIFITHNRATMELADQLVGVTMREPGVSRTVSVDVDEAAKMAGA